MTATHLHVMSGNDSFARSRAVELNANGVHVPYEHHRTTIDLFEARASDTPDRIAIVWRDLTFSYRELDQKANTLAARLLETGVRSGNLTPLLVGSGAAGPLAMIALMKLGAPFVPLDESWPPARLARILADLGAKAAICTPDLAHLAAMQTEAIVLVECEAIPGRAALDHSDRPTAGDLIYGIYTSGSTGVPKCALNLHLGLLNRFLTMSRHFAQDGQVVLQNSRHVFDSSIWQLLWPLTAGNTVVIPSRADILDLAETIEVVEKHGVTITDFVPSIFNALVAMLEANPALCNRLRSLRRLLIGGEEISPRAACLFRQLVPHVRLTNTYGPTECSIGSVWHEVVDATVPIPIGRPIDNTAAIVLDEEGQPAAPGQVGEIFIGGDCVGAGYLNAPELTRAAFVPNTLSGVRGASLYRTGDLGYADETGLLYFLARRDDQVKIGGVRIELGEIERSFNSHPRVRDAKVAVAGTGEGRRLVAYVVPSGPVTSLALLRHVSAALPPACVPKHVELVSRFPLTRNGKVDRHKLQDWALRQNRPRAAVLPANDVERAIQAVWATILGTSGIGVTESFFQCGGDSLSAHRLAAALQEILGRTITIREIASNTSIRDLAALRDAADPLPPQDRETELRQDMALPEDIWRRPSSSVWTFGTVLLTGATGFIGAHLLHALLAGSMARIVCLVRADGPAEASSRLEASLRHYELNSRLGTGRIEVVTGDFSAPRLGLDETVYARLTDTVDTVVHSGALVNLLLDYSSHRSANVVGTVELLRFAGLGRPKHVHFLSTLSVFPRPDDAAGRVPEAASTAGAAPSDGYSQSKWVAEGLLAIARNRGIRSTIYRLGEVGAHSEIAVPSRNGLIDLIARACLDLETCFETRLSIDHTPVDYVSAMIANAAKHGFQGEHLHLVAPASLRLSRLFDALSKRRALRRVPYGQFWRDLGEAGASASRAMVQLYTLLPPPTEDPRENDHRLAAILTDATASFALNAQDRLRDQARIPYPSLAGAIDRYVARLCAAPRFAGRTRHWGCEDRP